MIRYLSWILFAALPLFANIDTFFSKVPLRNNSWNGFNEVQMVELVRDVPMLVELIDEMTARGFRYGGDTGSTSKAYTNVGRRRICIGKNTTAEEACLSLMYELTNAKNGEKLQAIHDEYLHDPHPTYARGVDYASAILLIEADAIYHRCLLAVELNLVSLLKNPAYLRIVQEASDRASAIDWIHAEMLTRGKVHGGLKGALDHYIDLYFYECNNAVD